MLPLPDTLLFIAASVALALAPGPDNLFVLTQSALHGRAAGVWVTLGLCSGLAVHTLAVALGVAALFQTSALAFTLFKIVGAGYLLYLAWGAFRAGAARVPDAAPPLGAARLYRRGIVMNVTNPKVAIFFLAFLPQFADPARGSVTLQVLVCGLLFVVSALSVFCAIAFGGALLGDWLRRRPGAQRLLNRAAGVIFVGMALRLASASR